MCSTESQYEFGIDETVKKWRTLMDNDGLLLQQEFNELRKFDKKRIKIARNPINKSKNRYISIYPYDEDFCRVILQKKTDTQSNEYSGYINASIIHNIPPDEIRTTPNSRILYAAQGPNENTLDDFIQMIVEQEIKIIVMLSFSYDPITCIYAQQHAVYFGDKLHDAIETKSYQIRTIGIISGYRYIGRRLRIKSKLTNTICTCEHYHYPHFVDKRIPNDCHSMIRLVMRLLEKDNRTLPLLVHCSAGAGRTGVFIALYYLIEDFKHSRIFNVKKLIDTIRLYRAHLVQTVTQYEYIYRCLAELAIHPCDGRSLESFIEYFNYLLPTAHSTDSLIYEDFENRTNSIRPDTYRTTNIAEQHADRNRNQIFIPYDYNRVVLHPPCKSTYINASKVSNIIGPTGTILTQEPMISTLKDFIYMLQQEYQMVVVAVEQMDTLNYAQPEFIHRSRINCHRFSINTSIIEFNHYYQLYKMQIRHNNKNESSIFIFEYTGEWIQEGKYVPKNLEQFVRFIDQSIYLQNTLHQSRVGLTVHDRDGGTKAAFYCIAQNLIDRLLIDSRVAIANFVSDICQQRINALISLEQYIALHRIICVWNNLKRRGTLKCTVNSINN